MAVTPNLTVLRPLNQFSIIFQVKNLQVVSSVKQLNLFISSFIIKSLASQGLVFHKRGNGLTTIFCHSFFSPAILVSKKRTTDELRKGVDC